MHTFGGLNWYQGQSVPMEYQRSEKCKHCKKKELNINHSDDNYSFLLLPDDQKVVFG
jgi:hypothetical protein